MYKKIVTGVLGVSMLVALLGLQPNNVRAATAPSLGAAETFSALAALSMSSTASNTVLSGDLGLSPGLETSRTGTWTVGGTEYFGTGGVSEQAQTDALSAYNNLANQPSDGTWASNSPAPGVYDIALDTTFTGTLTLDGDYDDVWVFQIGQDMTFDGDVVMAGNAQPCNVFWQVGRDVTIASGATFDGTLIASRDISFASGATVDGRVISLNSSLVMSGTSTTISGPTCETAPPTTGGRNTGEITVLKTVINDSGGTATVSDFPLLMNGLFIESGVTNTFGTSDTQTFDYTVTETYDPAEYEQSFSGDCDENGVIQLDPGDEKFCTITNNDIGEPVIAPVPPQISVVKVPTPLALSVGPGEVTYAYTLTNTGTVPVTDITMNEDSCEPLTLSSGDVNGNDILEVDETWVYHCTTTLTETHTNTIVATGWANGISANDIARATVFVGEPPVIPPLINIVKTPNRFTLDDGGGMVTYTKKVTNPGEVALSDVQVIDDKCDPITFVSGDVNNNSLLEPTETWTYTCETNITETTLNTAVATGVANGIIARDIDTAIVTVAGPVPALPSTGTAAEESALMQYMAVIGAALVVAVTGLTILRKRVL